VQAIDFFGDGTRIPLLVVSKYSRGGRVVHTYYDHVSFDKFVEANWSLHETISPLGRDNLPNPVTARSNPYVPLNQPAIGDCSTCSISANTDAGSSIGGCESHDSVPQHACQPPGRHARLRGRPGR